VQPRGGPGDLNVQGAYAGPHGIALIGQLGGPLAEQANRARVVAWYSADGTNWLPAAVDDVSYGQAFEISSTFGPIFAVDQRLMALTTGIAGTAVEPATTLFESLDYGRSWRLADVPIPSGVFVADVTAGGPGYVAVGSTGHAADSTAVILTSPDGLDWMAGNGRIPVFEGGTPYGSLSAIASNGHLLIAVGSTRHNLDGPSSARVWMSRDGWTWTQQAQPAEPGASVQDVVASDNGFVLVGAVDQAPAAWWSADGATWERGLIASLGARGASAVTRVADGFIAIGDGIDHAVAWHSVDGRTWEPLGAFATTAAALRLVIPYGSGVLIAGNSPKPAEPMVWLSPPFSVRPPDLPATLPVDAAPATIAGETPGPGATPWPNSASVPGITLADLARLAGTLGMTCQSGIGSIPDSALTQWVMVCEANQLNTALRLEVHYWNPDLLGEVDVSAFPIDATVAADQPLIEAVAAATARLPYHGDTFPTDFVGWIRSNLYRAECLSAINCLLDDGSLQMELQLGYLGGANVRIEPSTRVR
jgi:hypothetical protein